jgi:hypothetical protein
VQGLAKLGDDNPVSGIQVQILVTHRGSLIYWIIVFPAVDVATTSTFMKAANRFLMRCLGRSNHANVKKQVHDSIFD